MPKINKDEQSQLNLSLNCLGKVPTSLYMNSPKSLETLNWGFTSYECSKDALKSRYEAMYPRLAYLIDLNIINPDKNGFYLINRYIENELTDELVITNASSGKSLGRLVVDAKQPVKKHGKHCKDRLGNYLYAPQTVIWVSKWVYRFGSWSDFKDAIRFDAGLREDLAIHI